MNVGKTTEILDALVGFDTTSRNSNLALVSWIENYLDGLGIAHVRIPDKTGTKANLWATIGANEAPGYILSGHTDVVPVDGQTWTNDPFRLTERDGRLYGRGACDMKGFVACCLAAVPDMTALARPIHLAFSYDEEVGCVGVHGISSPTWTARAMQPMGCVVGEPTKMGVVTGHKGKRSFRRPRTRAHLPFLARALRGQCGRICGAADRAHPGNGGSSRKSGRARSALRRSLHDGAHWRGKWWHGTQHRARYLHLRL